MTDDSLLLDLRCPACSWIEASTKSMLERHLRAIGMLKRDPHASIAEITELAMATAGRMACPACGRVGLLAAPAPEQDIDWPGPRNCAICGRPIPAERLEVFPDAMTCVACQKADEQGLSPAAAEYCPKCGAPLVVRQTRGQGITRYSTVCTGTPPCRL